MPLHLVTGGARSGKSSFALARAQGGVYIATAEAGDDEMRDRIARHRRERGDTWRTIEAPIDPAAVFPREGVVVLDCLTLWISNLMLAGREDDAIAVAATDLAAKATACTSFVVTNEVGLGIVPEHPLARRFRDLAGRVNQIFATQAAEVWLLVCGQPLRIK
jgi:adenosylcobinamide kinase / adenosylcobinamide-phosphate guanylyltransferase